MKANPRIRNLRNASLALIAGVFFGILGSVAAAPSAINSSGVVTVNLDAAVTVSVSVVNASTYRLTLSSGSWAPPSGAGLSLSSTTVLEISKGNDVDKVVIEDSAANANVTFTGSATENFEDIFEVTLDNGGTGAGTIVFSGRCAFIGGSGLTASTTRSGTPITVNSGIEVSAADAGAISLTATAGSVSLASTGSKVITENGALAITATLGAITTGASSQIEASGSGAVTLLSGTGISTGSSSEVSSQGGDVTITAGTSFQPGATSTYSTIGSGKLEVTSSGATGTWNASNVAFTATTVTGSLLLKSNGSSLQAGASTITTGGGNLELNAATSISTNTAAQVRVTAGAGTLKILGVTSLSLGSNSFTTTTGGAIDLIASGVTGTWTANLGSTISSGGGAITATATGGAWLASTNSNIDAAGGSINLTAGTTFTLGASGDLIGNFARIQTNGAGAVTVNAGSSITANAYSQITTVNGNLGMSATTSFATGGFSEIKSTGSGSVNLGALTTFSLGANSIASASAGNLSMSSGVSNTHSLIANSNTTISAGGSVTIQGGGTVTIGAGTDTALSDALVTGGGLVTVRSTAANVVINPFADVSSSGGVLLESFTSLSTAASTKVRSTGASPVTLSALTAIGIGSSSQVTSQGGTVSITAGTTFQPGTNSTFSTNGSGNLLITSSGGTGTWNAGNVVFTASTVTGSITLSASAASFTLGASTVTTGGGSILMGGTSVTTGTGSLVEVLSGAGDITLSATTTSLSTGASSILRTVDGNISASSTTTLAIGASSLAASTGDGGISLYAPTTLTTTAGTLLVPTRLITAGTGGISLVSLRDIIVNVETSISVVNGDVLLSANQAIAPTTGSFTAINFTGNITSSGSGDIEILGRAGDGGSSNRGVVISGSLNNRGKVQSSGSGAVTVVGTNLLSASNFGSCYGIQVSGSTALVASNTGALTLNGTSSANGTGGAHDGIYIEAGAKVEATNADVVLTGLSGEGAASGNNAGIRVIGANTEVKVAAGTLTLSGTSRAVGTGTANIGVRVESGAKILSTALNVVPVIISGFGADSTRTVDGNSSNYGVYLTGQNTEVSTSRGSITISGQAGDFVAAPPVSSDNHVGVYILDNVSILSLDDASISITGVAGAGGDDLGMGVYMGDNNISTKCQVASLDGSITITGTSGGSGVGSANTDGVRLDGSGVEVASTGSGTITIEGIRPVASTVGFAFNALGASRLIHTAGVGNVVVNADSINLSTTCVVDVGPSNAVTLRPYTAGRGINLGAADNGQLGLTDAELDRVTAGTLNLGSTSSGTLTVSLAQSRPASTVVNLISGANIELSAGTVNTAGGTLAFSAPTGIVLPTVAGTDVTSATTSIAAATTLSILINGTTPETQYKPLNISGNLALNASADLDLTGSYVPVIGETFTLISVGGAGAVAGTFAGKPEGYSFYNLFGSNMQGVLSYAGGVGGNDVTLTVVAQPEIDVVDVDHPIEPGKPIFDAQGEPVDFGSTDVGISVERTFKIINSGSADLNVTSITVPLGFEVVLPHPTSVPAEGDADFDIRLTALSGGVFGGEVSIVNNDPTPAPSGENPFTFQVVGTVEPLTGNMVTVSGTAPNRTVNVGVANTGNNPMTITINSLSATYTLVRSGLGAGPWSFVDVPGVVTGSGTSTMTITKAEVSQVNVMDGVGLGSGLVNVIFAGEGGASVVGNDFDDSFNVVLDADYLGTSTAGSVTFSGFCTFTGTNTLTVSTARNVVVNASRTVSVVDGDLSLFANRLITETTGFAGLGLGVSGEVLSSGKGKILLSGRGGAAAGVYGVNISGAIRSTSEADDAGTITILGTGGKTTGAANYNAGLVVTGASARVESARGSILLDGDSSSEASSGLYHFGVWVTAGAKIRSTGLLPVDVAIFGKGGFGTATSTGNTSPGVWVSLAGSEISSSGPITIEGEGRWLGSGYSYTGVLISSDAAVRHIGDIPADIIINGVGAPAPATGSTNTNAGVDITGANTAVTSTGGAILIDGEALTTSNGNHNSGVRITGGAKVRAVGSLPVGVSITGTGAVCSGNSVNNHGVLIETAGTEIVSLDADVVINGTSRADTTGNSHVGVLINGAKVAATGTENGSVEIAGLGPVLQTTSASGSNHGVHITGVGAEVTTTNGDIMIDGTARAVSTGSVNQGVLIQNGPKIRSLGMDSPTTISITGRGAPATGASIQNFGVNLVGSTTAGQDVELTSANGSILIDGESLASSGTGTSNIGVRIQNQVKVLSSGPAGALLKLSIQGKGANSTLMTNGAVFNHGVWIAGTTGVSPQVSSASVEIDISGVGGTLSSGSEADSVYGVVIEANAEVSSTVDAPITITGVAGTGGDDNMWGVYVADSGATVSPVENLAEMARISSKTGLVTITGTAGGSGPTSVNADGVRLDSVGVRLYSETSANFVITGYKSESTSVGSAVNVVGQARLLSAGSGTYVINADSVNLSTSCQFNMGTSSVTFQPTTSGREIEIGGTTAGPLETAGTALGLIDTETDRVLSGTLIIGGVHSGNVRVIRPVTTAPNVNLSLVSLNDIVQSDGGSATTTGTITTDGTGAVQFTTINGSYQPIPDNLGVAPVLVDVTAPGGVSFGSGTKLAITMNGSPINTPPTLGDSEAATGYRRLTVNGPINLTGAELIIGGTFVPIAPAAGPFPVVVATGILTSAFTYPVVGNIGGSNYGAAISYNVSGNNAVLAIVASPEIAAYSGVAPPTDELTDGVGLPGPVDFGTPLYLQTVTKTFTIENKGTADLEVSSIVAPSGYTILGAPGAPIASNGGTATFQVRFDAESVGVVTGDVVINSNDANEAAFSFPVTGNVQTFGTDGAGGGGDTVTVVADGGRNITVRVPPASPLINGIAGNLHYQLVLNTGTWGGSDVIGVVTGNGTNTLTIPKSGVSMVNIIDAAGANTVAFEGRASANDVTGVGRTFDDDFQVVLDHPAAGGITITGNCVFTAANSLNASTVKNITSNGNTTLSVADGDLTFTAGMGPIPLTGNLDAISILGTVTTTGEGDILLTGRGSESTQCWGITIGGVGGASGKVTSTSTGANAGSINLVGIGGPNIGGGSLGYGVHINGVNTEVVSSKGAINVTGTSDAVGTGGTHAGIVVVGGAKIRSEGTEDVAITLTGTGGSAPSNSNFGVWITGNNTRVTAQNGSVTITGTGGSDGGATRTLERGVLIENNAEVSSTGAATITITGTGKNPGDDNNTGVAILGTAANPNAKVTSLNGAIVINGNGGGSNAAGSVGNYGIVINGGTVSSTGSATIALNGAEGASPTLATNEGFAITGDATVSSFITTSAGTGAVTVSADRIAIDTTAAYASLTAGTNGVTFRPLTAARPIDLGGADTALTLGITDAELDRIISAGTITIGGGSAGTLTVTGPVTPASGAGVALASNGDIIQSVTGTISTTGAVSFASTAGTVQPLPTGADVTASGISFGPGSDLAIAINALVPDDGETGYRRLTVAGDVDLTGADLILSGTHTPLLNEVYLIVDNQGANPIAGTFNGLPEGAIIPGFLPPALANARISYVGGTGNDVTLTVEPAEIEVDLVEIVPPDTSLTDNGSTVDFGSLAPPANNARTFRIRNVGSQPLNIGTILTSGGNAADFTINQAGVTTPLDPNDATTFTVTFSPLASGARSTTLQIPSNDANENPFDVNLTGIGLAILLPGALDDVLTGGQAPDATGAVSIGEYDTPYRNGIIAENGFRAFTASLKLSGVAPVVTNSDDSGIWKQDSALPNSLKLLAREGSADPEAAGLFAQFAQNPVPTINDAGQVTFRGTLNLAGPVTAANDTGVWSEIGGGGLNLILREGEELSSGGPTVANLDFSAYATAETAADKGEAAMAIKLNPSLNDSAVVRISVDDTANTRAISILARQGEASSRGPNFGNLVGGYSDPRMDADGNIAFAALIGSSESLWYQPLAGPLVSVFAAGDAAPDTDTNGATNDANFSGMDMPSMGSGGVFCFRGQLASTPGSDNADGKRNDGIWRGTVGGGFTCILRRGDDNSIRPGLFDADTLLAYPNVKVSNPWSGWLTNANNGAWRAWLDLDGDGVAGTRTGENDIHALFADTSGVMRMVVKEGDPVPGVPGAVFSRFDLPIVGGQEQMVFIARITGPGVTAANDIGVWRQAPNGGPLTLVVRTGEQLTTSLLVDPVKTISNLRFPGSLNPGATTGAERRWEQPVIDQNGQLIIYVDFVGGLTGELLAP